MGDEPLQNIDRRILHLLQLDARSTDTAIAKEIGVTGTTISNRMSKLEERGVIRGYNPEINYEKAGYPMDVLFICSVNLSERSEVAEKALDVQGVVNVREMLASEENLHVEVVAKSMFDIKESTQQLDELGLQIVSSNILALERIQPWNHFHQDREDQNSHTEPETESTDE